MVLQGIVGFPLCSLLEDFFRKLLGDQLEEDADSHLFREGDVLALLRLNRCADFGDRLRSQLGGAHKSAQFDEF